LHFDKVEVTALNLSFIVLSSNFPRKDQKPPRLKLPVSSFSFAHSSSLSLASSSNFPRKDQKPPSSRYEGFSLANFSFSSKARVPSAMNIREKATRKNRVLISVSP
jgi:hypothetical protein